MIMGFKVPYELAIFFAGIFVVLFTTSYSRKFSLLQGQSSNDFYSFQYEGSQIQPNYLKIGLEKENDQSFNVQKKEVNLKCDPLPQTARNEELSKILSRDIFDQTDPFGYITAKVKEISNINNYVHIKFVVNDLLTNKELSLCYIPYAKLLSSFLECWIHLTNAYGAMLAIRTRRSANENDSFKSLLQEVSSSVELAELFSSDIFYDPEPQMRLFNKFFDMPSNEITNLRIQFKNFLQKWDGKFDRNLPFSIWYVYYVNSLFKLIDTKSTLGNLKRDMAAIQHKLASDTNMVGS